MIDLPMSNQAYTWSSMREDPSLVKLDRVLVDHEWEAVHPTCSVQGLPRVMSDHSPLLVSGGCREQRTPIFRFENWWLLSPGFTEVVADSWKISAGVLTGARMVAFKLKRLKLLLKQWNRAELKKRRERKVHLAEHIFAFERWEEAGLVSEEDKAMWVSMKNEWALICRMEEAAWRQRSQWCGSAMVVIHWRGTVFLGCRDGLRGYGKEFSHFKINSLGGLSGGLGTGQLFDSGLTFGSEMSR
ncbi:hypothetical protein QJS10_CPB17g00989 [Acorus calamus]|uniref:Reverse transcriptase n=1 Tax=Acorus calamus TaxID=4465 RepID=A0AAV9CRA8_ACOCL|nr:hypothetical protein QJS10_CPB17g00989 [Acorus calamus]